MRDLRDKKRLEDKPGRPRTGWGSQGLRKKEIAREFKEFPMRTQHRYHSKDRTPSSQATKRKEPGDVTGKGESLSCIKAWDRNSIGILRLPLESSSSKGSAATCRFIPSHLVEQKTC